MLNLPSMPPIHDTTATDELLFPHFAYTNNTKVSSNLKLIKLFLAHSIGNLIIEYHPYPPSIAQYLYTVPINYNQHLAHQGGQAKFLPTN